MGDGGEVVVRAPIGANKARIDEFVRSKSDWIENAINKEKNKIVPPDFLSGNEFCFCGRNGHKTLLYNRVRPFYDNESKTFFLPLHCGDGERAAAFRSAAKKEFLRFAAYRTEQIANICGFNYGKVSVGSARTRWGVCNAENDITYTVFLAFLPQELIDYVILHELCHVKQKNHSRAFWSLLCRFMPDAKIRRKKLHEYSLFLTVL